MLKSDFSENINVIQFKTTNDRYTRGFILKTSYILYLIIFIHVDLIYVFKKKKKNSFSWVMIVSTSILNSFLRFLMSL